MKLNAAALVVSSLGSVAHAHLFMSSPVPLSGNAIKDPLAGDGSNFPCHGVTLPGSGGQSMQVGSTQSLIFDLGNGANTAVHGGGSCQLSITYETDPALVKLPSSWSVIYSIEEGCPTNSLANLDGQYIGPSGNSYTGSLYCSDPTTNGFDCVNTFNFTLPPGVKNGQATLAWTWFNNVGNREMYMNCAAIDISGGASDDSVMDTYPDMFVANLAGNGLPTSCDSTASVNVQFPNPGAYLTTKTAFSRNYVASATKQFPIQMPSGCPSNAGSSPGGSAGSSNSAATITSAPTAYSSSSSAVHTSTSTAHVSTSAAKSSTTLVATTKSASSRASTTLSVSTTVKTSTTGKASTVTSASGKSIATSTANKATTTAKTQAAATSASTTKPSTTKSSTAASATSSCPAGSVPCSTFNALVCPDKAHYGLCDYNGCAISQVVAPGTVCQNGMIIAARKRSLSHRHRARNGHRQ